VVLKLAASADGGTAAPDGSSQWITGPEARADAHRLRAESGAVMVGAGTALADRPTLTFRDLTFEDGLVPFQPVRVLLDAAGRVPASGPLFDTGLAPTLVITTAGADPDTRKAWKEAGAAVEEAAPVPGGSAVDLDAALVILGARGILQVMVEGGAALHGSFLRAGLADRLVVYTGGAILGAEGLPVFAGPGPGTLAEASRWRLTGLCQLGDDARLDWEPVHPRN
jgi:diaminohydroxyphosphoribosylaminopyrimidine deaminase/5-amino-6-(5-phosphoribosylamino)uracil reductase